jgi:hypothetical protein
MARRRPPANSRVPAHRFVDDPEAAERYVPVERRWAGSGPRRWCRRCGLPGQPGDARHPVDARGEQLLEEAAAVAARITGDRDLVGAR